MNNTHECGQGMSRTSRYGMLLLLLLICEGGLTAQNANMVRITSQFDSISPKPGYGMIVYERDGEMLIATARHVIEHADDRDTLVPASVDVYFYKSPLPVTVQRIHKIKNIDLAILAVKNAGDVDWEYREIVESAKEGDEVWLLGRDATWNRTPSGKVTKVSENKLIADLQKIPVGVSGGPLVSANGIVGMIDTSEGYQISAIPIEPILRHVAQYVNIANADISDIPYYHAGINGFIGAPGTFDSQASDYVKLMSGFSAGLYCEMALHPYYSVRLDANLWRVETEEAESAGNTIRFRNAAGIFNASFVYYPGKSFGWGNATGVYFIAGYAYLLMNPEAMVDGQTWTSLKELGISNDASSHAINVGFGTNFSLGGDYLIGYELSAYRTSSKYVHINPLKGLEGNDSDDWLIMLTVRLGYVFRTAMQKVKLLR